MKRKRRKGHGTAAPAVSLGADVVPNIKPFIAKRLDLPAIFGIPADAKRKIQKRMHKAVRVATLQETSGNTDNGHVACRRVYLSKL
jgi:hypothetical protein